MQSGKKVRALAKLLSEDDKVVQMFELNSSFPLVCKRVKMKITDFMLSNTKTTRT